MANKDKQRYAQTNIITITISITRIETVKDKQRIIAITKRDKYRTLQKANSKINQDMYKTQQDKQRQIINKCRPTNQRTQINTNYNQTRQQMMTINHKIKLNKTMLVNVNCVHRLLWLGVEGFSPSLSDYRLPSQRKPLILPIVEVLEMPGWGHRATSIPPRPFRSHRWRWDV